MPVPDPILIISLLITAWVWFKLTDSSYSLAVMMVIMAVTLAIWFLQYKAALSEQRLQRMMTRTGLPVDISTDEKTAAVIEAARRTCRKCRDESLCERWLDGEITGKNGFCPNAQLFRDLLIRPGQEARIHP